MPSLTLPLATSFPPEGREPCEFFTLPLWEGQTSRRLVWGGGAANGTQVQGSPSRPKPSVLNVPVELLHMPSLTLPLATSFPPEGRETCERAKR